MRKTVLVTGASGGIGRECALSFAEEYNVVVHYHSNRRTARDVVEKIREGGGNAFAYRCDVSDPRSVEEMVTAVTEEFGTIDTLVNNAAVFQEKGLLEISEEETNLEIDVNMKGVVYVTKAVLPRMIERGSGHVINVSSTSGIHGSPSDQVYSATKGGVNAFTVALARKYTSDGVFSNAVAPGPTKTKMMRPERRPPLEEASPIDRLIKPTEIADTVRFLSQTTSISGEIIEVDAGWRL